LQLRDNQLQALMVFDVRGLRKRGEEQAEQQGEGGAFHE
jgi:hypothetical protein